MPKTIYSSEKVLPYVYYGVHKITGQFYFGSRYGEQCYLNKGRPSHLDFGHHYFTSSKEIKELGLDNFDWTILAEFFDGEGAREFEDCCIEEFWKHPLSLNFHKNGKKFINLYHTEKAKSKMSSSHLGVKLSKMHAEAIGKGQIGSKHSEKTLQLLKRPKSESHKMNLRKPKANTEKMKKPQNILICPHCKKEGGNAMRRWHFDFCKFAP
jgi:hypothetical protein